MKELEMTYQQQVDDMFFYNHRCCMKKHDITNDIPNIPFDNDKDEVVLGDNFAVGDGSTVDGYGAQD
ncbi:hypothetical protein VitviT2T_024411 [Vitis vinifera]|uniref:Uncharacterized protein n=1 Tax=Vitis vinifera TaxID=29760 RepID=A0ABY9DGG2_VITVI|nr:hypothetical protein VitviT2T_024411 [Vitis vinifera]